MRYKVTTSLLAASLLVFGASWAGAVDQWPDTGQTICYDNAGIVVNCVGTDGYLGQDGFYNGPARSYDTLTANTVIDNVTKLQWYNPDSAQAVPISYADAGFYLDGLNLASTLGHNDWRIPTAQEMATLIDASIQPWSHTSGVYGVFVMPTNTNYPLPPPSIDLINDAVYWTQTDSPNNSGQQMVVRFKRGSINDGAGGESGGPDFGSVAYVRPVRDVTPE